MTVNSFTLTISVLDHAHPVFFSNTLPYAKSDA